LWVQLLPFEDFNKITPKTDFSRYQLWPIPVSVLLFSSRRACDARLECGRPELATHFEPRLAGFRANVHGRLNGALGVKTRRERRWRSAR